MCSFGSCKTRFEFLSQFRKVRNAFECFVTQVQTCLPKTKRVWPMKINVLCTDIGLLVFIHCMMNLTYSAFAQKKHMNPAQYCNCCWHIVYDKIIFTQHYALTHTHWANLWLRYTNLWWINNGSLMLHFRIHRQNKTAQMLMTYQC